MMTCPLLPQDALLYERRRTMDKRTSFNYEIQYTKAADKFLKTHEDVRTQYEEAIKELLVGDHPEKVDVKRIRGKRNDDYRFKLGGYRVGFAFTSLAIPEMNTGQHPRRWRSGWRSDQQPQHDHQRTACECERLRSEERERSGRHHCQSDS